MTDELIHTVNLTKIYGAGETSIRTLDEVNLSVPKGEFLAIMGPSGCGKSTLLNMLGALEPPLRRGVGRPGTGPPQKRGHFPRQDGRLHLPLHNLLPTLTAQENIEVPMQGQLPAGKRRERAKKLLEIVGLIERGGALPTNSPAASGGTWRIRALANGPALILADEPTGSLDTQSGGGAGAAGRPQPLPGHDPS